MHVSEVVAWSLRLAWAQLAESGSRERTLVSEGHLLVNVAVRGEGWASACELSLRASFERCEGLLRPEVLLQRCLLRASLRSEDLAVRVSHGGRLVVPYAVSKGCGQLLASAEVCCLMDDGTDMSCSAE